MKILMLADPNSSHVVKWAKSLARNNIKVFIFGFTAFDKNLYKENPEIEIFSAEFDKNSINTDSRDIHKILIYLKLVKWLKSIVNNIKPDIVHAHMASSYGLLGSLVGFQPFIISMWGHDVFKFPRKSRFHRYALEFNFRRANVLLSTSHVMANEAKRYTGKTIETTPFGIDLEQFKPIKGIDIFNADDIVIGTVKTLEEIYGIETLVRSFATLKDRMPDAPLKLLIVGSGEQKEYIQGLIVELGIVDHTVITGQVEHQCVHLYHNAMSIEVFLSNSESFGVSVLEASACGKPVVVSNVGGLPEVVVDGVTGFIVPPMNPQKAADAIELLIMDVSLRKKMGSAGRLFVSANFRWDDNVQQMISIYKDTLRCYGRKRICLSQ